MTIWYQQLLRCLGTSHPPPPLHPPPSPPPPFRSQPTAPHLRSPPLWDRPVPRRRMSIRPPRRPFRRPPSTPSPRRFTVSSDRWASSPPASPMWSAAPVRPRHHQGNRRLRQPPSTASNARCIRSLDSQRWRVGRQPPPGHLPSHRTPPWGSVPHPCRSSRGRCRPPRSTPPDLPFLFYQPQPRVCPISMACMANLLRRLLHPSSPQPPHHHLTLFQSHKSLFHIRLPQFHPFPTLPTTNPPNMNRLMIMKMASVFPAITNFPSLLLMERKILLGG